MFIKGGSCSAHRKAVLLYTTPKMVLCLLWMRRKHCSSLHLSVLVNILKEWVIRSTELIFTQQQPDSPLAQLASTLILKNARAFTTKNTKKLQNIKMKHTTLTKSKILLHKYMLINLRSFWIKTGLFVLSFITFSGLENAMYKFHDFFRLSMKTLPLICR